MPKLKELTISSDLDNLSHLEKYVAELSRNLKLSSDQQHGILLVLNEAVTNAIIHGNHNNPRKKVRVISDIDEHKLIFSVIDEGSGFDPNRVPDPLEPENQLKTSGRGIYLMKYYADNIFYSHKGTKVNIVFQLEP